MRVVGLLVVSKPKETQGEPQEATPKTPQAKTTPKKTSNK